MLTSPDRTQTEDPTERLLAFIAAQDFAPGDRLPAERHLIEILGVRRSALRKALEQLERDGAIWRHVGKGTFVSRAAADSSRPDAFSGIGAQLTPFRMMRARITIEPAIAREAAANCSREALARIQGALARQRAAASWTEYERQDDQLHRAIAEAADNALLLALFDSLNRVRREVAWGSVTRSSARPSSDHSSFAEHDAIAEAIEAHDQDAAFQAMRAHLKSVASRLFDDM